MGLWGWLLIVCLVLYTLCGVMLGLSVLVSRTGSVLMPSHVPSVSSAAIEAIAV